MLACQLYWHAYRLWCGQNENENTKHTKKSVCTRNSQYDLHKVKSINRYILYCILYTHFNRIGWITFNVWTRNTLLSFETKFISTWLNPRNGNVLFISTWPLRCHVFVVVVIVQAFHFTMKFNPTRFCNIIYLV